MEVDPMSAISIVVVVLGLMVEHFHYRAQLQERVVTLETQIKDCVGLDNDVRELTTKINLFWCALENYLPDILMGGNPIEKGSEITTLLEKYKYEELSTSEKKTLIKLLEEEVKTSDDTSGDKLAILLLVATLKPKVVENVY